MTLPFRIKICGVTNGHDAIAAVTAGADALGLNFFRGSKRFVPVEKAAKIAADVRSSTGGPSVCLVGVFVNAVVDEIIQTVNAVKLDAVQLHGDETPEFVLAVDDALERISDNRRPMLIHAFRCQAGNLGHVAQHLLACERPYAPLVPQAVLLDAYTPGVYGGTGEVFDWNAVREHREQFGGRPIILAGGLTPQNVAAAIQAAGPDAVDVASGVESSPGAKDAQRLRSFISAARAAFDSDAVSSTASQD